MRCYSFIPFHFTGQKLCDGKTVGGKGRLTSEPIDLFQTWYGAALRARRDDPEAMRTATIAILHHNSDPPDHRYCPTGERSWCRWKREPAVDHTPPTNLLPPAIVELIRPVFEALTDVRLLQGVRRCLTQNQNESFHNVLWRYIHKELPQTQSCIALGLNLAILQFNRGWSNSQPTICQEGGLDFGENALQALRRISSGPPTWCVRVMTLV